VKKGKKEKRKKKEDPPPSGEGLGSVTMLDAKDTVAAPLPATEVSPKINSKKARLTKKIKSESRSKLKVLATGETSDVTTSATPLPITAEVARVVRDVPEGNWKEKGHPGNHLEDDDDTERVAQGNNETSKEKRKEKKKKRKLEGRIVGMAE